MPILDGHGLAAELRKSRPNIQILIVSSMSERDFPADSCHNASLLKPVNLESVAVSVAKLLSK